MAKNPNSAYHGDEPYIFVTYAHRDASVVHPQIRWLQDQGFNVWWDEGISPGAVWRSEVTKALRECSLLLYFVTPSSVISEHCIRELHFALDEHHRSVLAVHLEETTLPDALALSLSDRQALLMHRLDTVDYETRLVAAISKYLNQPIPEITSPGSSQVRMNRPAITRLAGFALFGVGLTLGVWLADLGEPKPLSQLSRFVVAPPEGVSLTAGATALAFADDGRHFVFRGESRDTNQLYLRRLDELVAHPIEGTEATEIFNVALSPDGQEVLFHDLSAKALKRVRVSGGPASTIAKGLGSFRGRLTWGDDGSIVYSTFSDPALWKLDISGGSAQRITMPDEGEYHLNPHLLEGSRNLLFEARRDDQPSQIRALSLATDSHHFVVEGSMPLVTSSGHILYVRDGVVWASPFDERLQKAGEQAVPVLQGVSGNSVAYEFSVARNGSLIYSPRSMADGLAWLTVDGNYQFIDIPAIFLNPRLSPDGNRIAFISLKGRDLWVHDLDRGSANLIATGTIVIPQWSPDGEQIIYSRFIDGTPTLAYKRADGSGEEILLEGHSRSRWATSWTARSGLVLYFECDGWLVACDLGRLNVDGSSGPELFLESEFDELHPALSPDERWIAYESNRSGASEIYVRPYPDLDAGLWKISVAGGKQPTWSPDGSAIFYSAVTSARDRQLMSVSVDTKNGFHAGVPTPMFDFLQAANADNRNFDLHPNGSRLLVQVPASSGSVAGIVYVANWLDEVRRLIPADRE